VNRRITKPGKELTLAEHKALAGHLKAARHHLREARHLLDGRAYAAYCDRLERLLDGRFMTRLRSHLDDELARLPETKAMDNREFCSVYYGELGPTDGRSVDPEGRG